MLHDASLHDVIGGPQAYIHREIYGASNFAYKTMRGPLDACALRARQDYKLALQE